MKLTKLNKETQESSWSDFIAKAEREKNYVDLSAYIAFQVGVMMRNKKIKQKDLADMLGVTPQQISKILSGHENLTIETIEKLRRTLSMEIDISVSGIENFLNPPVVFANVAHNACSYFSLTIKHAAGKTVDQHIEDIKPVINSFISNIPISENGDYSIKEAISEYNAIVENYN